MDKTDRKILNLLLNDSRLSYRQIAGKLGVSTATISSRVGKLEKDGTVKSYSSILDYEKVGFGVEAIIFVRTFGGRDRETMKKLAGFSNISAVYDIVGDFDIAVLAKFENRKQLNEFLQDVRHYKSVERTYTTMILGVFKEETVKLDGAAKNVSAD